MKPNVLNQNQRIGFQRGQSLIETIVAIFVLTTGLASGLALAIYSFGASSNIVEQITATGLAREGVEMVRAMRDSNWLADPSLDDCENGQKCYASWLTQTEDISGATGAGKNYILSFKPSGVGVDRWDFPPVTGVSANTYRLYKDPATKAYFFDQTSANPTNYFRKITIINSSTAAPYTPTSPLMLVRSVVWWHGKNCAPITDYNSPSDTSCKIITEEYLTNWKNY